VVAIDTITGAGTLIGVSGLTSTLALATNNLTGTMYTVDNITGHLDTIDPITGLGTLGPVITGIGAKFVNGLAFDSSGVLFAEAIDPSSGSSAHLFTVNTTTGAATLVGPISPNINLDLAFSASDALYAWNSAHGLMTVNTATGAGTLVNPSFSPPSITALTFDGGTLLGAGSSLFAIDTSTSATTLIGPIGFDIRGIALAPTVPEPGTLLLSASGLAGFFAGRRKRRMRR
jgi:hypothetical protein